MTGLLAINFRECCRRSLYCKPEVFVRVNGKQSQSFHAGVTLRQVLCLRCVLPPLLFIINVNWIDKLSRTGECVTIGRCKSSRLLFEDHLVLLTSSEYDFQHALNVFAAACDIAGMKINTSKTEVHHPSRNLVKFSL